LNISSGCRFNKKYFLLALCLFTAEVLIALYIHDRIIRPYVGDYLVVILLYSMVKTILDIPAKSAALSVLLFAYAIETLQYFHVVNLLGLQRYKLARVVIGTDFEWIDLIAYTLGVLTIIVWERKIQLKERH
jgi:hypothetical protein